MRYYVEIWANNIKNNEKYTPIIPYIVFQNRKEWKYRTFESCFEHFDPLFLPYTPLFEYLLIATSPENETALRNIEAYHSYMVFKAMRQVATNQLDKADLVLLLQEFELMPFSEFGKILSQLLYWTKLLNKYIK